MHTQHNVVVHIATYVEPESALVISFASMVYTHKYVCMFSHVYR